MLAQKEEQLLASTEEDRSLQTNNSGKITENILPSFSATNPLVCNADLIRANVYSTLLIPGPANFYSTTYTALIGAHNISTKFCGYTTKTLISLDLDLYEKCFYW